MFEREAWVSLALQASEILNSVEGSPQVGSGLKMTSDRGSGLKLVEYQCRLRNEAPTSEGSSLFLFIVEKKAKKSEQGSD